MDLFDSSHSRPGDSRGFIHKKLLGAASGFITGGPTGAISGFFGGGGRAPTPTPFQFGGGGGFSGGGSGGRFPAQVLPPTRGGGIAGAIGRARNLAQGIGAASVFATGGSRTEFSVNACDKAPCGFHKAKQTYVRKIDPCQPFQLSNLEIIPEGTFIEGASRRRNPSNGKANSHAMSRLDLAVPHAKKLLKAVGYRQISKGGTTRRGSGSCT